jgi:TetR/AcrR family transcriptional repressor of nem operon
MAKASNRTRILTEGLKVVHAHGFAGASVRDIVAAAGVPQGSFTNHFTSKEAFGLEVIELYFARAGETIAATLLNDALPPLARLAAYIDANTQRLNQTQMRNGCLFGNFTAEASDSSEPIRLRLVEIFAAVQAAIATCLQAAVEAGQLPADFACEETAGFIVSSLQGANLLAKAQRSPVPVDRFKRILFETILK